MKKLSGFLLFMIGCILGMTLDRKKTKKFLTAKEQKINKFEGYFYLYEHWMGLKLQNKGLKNFFMDHNYRNIAVYGMGKLAVHLIEDLKGSSVTIAYAVDKKVIGTTYDFEIISGSGDLPLVDVIVVTATFDFENIKMELSKRVGCPIISLEEIVFNC